MIILKSGLYFYPWGKIYAIYMLVQRRGGVKSVYIILRQIRIAEISNHSFPDLLVFASDGNTPMPVTALRNSVESYPTSYFVNREDEVLTLPFAGAPAQLTDYEAVIDALLEGEKATVGEKVPAGVSEENTCCVIVSDSEGESVAGQWCSFAAMKHASLAKPTCRVSLYLKLKRERPTLFIS